MSNTIAENAFGRFLKFWRKVHKVSQEALAFKLNSSARHISRLENGSSRASESLIKDIAQVLSLGERDTNHLLIAAGYAAELKKVDFNSDKLKWLRNAMMLNLRALDPHPTALLDSSANILMVNKAWVGFYRQQNTNIENVTNLFDLLFNIQGAEINNSTQQDTLSVILMSLQQQALFSNKKEDYDLPLRLAKSNNVPSNWQQRAATLEPMASFRTQTTIKGIKRSFYSVNSTVGALGPTAYASAPQLTINTLFPEDDNFDLNAFIQDDIKHPLLHY